MTETCWDGRLKEPESGAIRCPLWMWVDVFWCDLLFWESVFVSVWTPAPSDTRHGVTVRCVFSKRREICERAACLSSLLSRRRLPNTNFFAWAANQISVTSRPGYKLLFRFSQRASQWETQVTAHYREYLAFRAYDWTFGLFISICMIVQRDVKDKQEGSEGKGLKV